MKKIKIILLAVSFLFSTSVLFAEGEKGLIQKIQDKFTKTKTGKAAGEAKREPQAAAKKARKDLTVSELSEYIKETLEREEEILNLIPGFKEEKDDKGDTFYTYQGTRLENLNRENLDKLFNRVQNEAVRIRTERLNRQLESIRQAQAASLAAQQASRVPTIVTPPPQPPTPPRPPPTQQVPKPPPRPPAPPKR